MNGVLVADRYRLDRRIGAGGMGYVWLAWDEVLRRNVAVKEVHLPDGLSDTEVAELHARTLREAQAAARLSHPNVVRTYDVLRNENRPYIVMEYVPSRSLAEAVKTDGPLLPEPVARIGLALLGALKAAHDAGVLHRDIKPGNVLLGDDGRVVLTDFGLAIFDDVGMHLTHPGVVHGSPQFIAPERAKDGTSTAASDLWSLGATLYAAVEGQSPYARSTSYATLAALATEPPDSPRKAGPLKPILNGLLRREPSVRMSIEEATARLQLISGSAAGSLPSAGFIPPRVAHEDSGQASGAATNEPPATESPASVARERRAVSDDTAPPRQRPSPEPPAEAITPPADTQADVGERVERSWDLGYTDKTVRRFRRQRRALVSAVAGMAVVMVALAAGYLIAPHAGSDNTSQAAPVYTLPPGGPPPGGPPPGVLNWPCTPTIRAPVMPFDPVQPKKQPPYGLISGYGWFDEAMGFQIAAPVRFQVAHDAQTACLYDPSTPRVLGVHRWAFQTKDPVRALKDQLSALAARLPGYKLLRLNAMPLQQNQAEAEYTYRGPNGAQHAVMHDFIDGRNAAYAVTWDTQEFDWTSSSETWNLIVTSFETN
jgi:serine/threonine protein kinase